MLAKRRLDDFNISQQYRESVLQKYEIPTSLAVAHHECSDAICSSPAAAAYYLSLQEIAKSGLNL